MCALDARKRSMPLAFAWSLFSGLAAAQLISTVAVYLSNRQLHASLTAITHAGWLGVPNEIVRHQLLGIGMAAGGGALFTLTVGAMISLASLALAWLYRQGAGRRFICISSGIVWAALVVAINWRARLILATAYLVVVPLAAGGLYICLTPLTTVQTQPWLRRWMPVVGMVLLALAWMTQIHGDLFLTVRDSLLLSNRAGLAVNQFYYRYTLPAAEVFKSLAQKTWRACRVADLPTDKRQQVTRVLARQDYLTVDGPGAVDLTVSLEGADRAQLLDRQHRPRLSIAWSALLQNPLPALQTFSQETDAYAVFRVFVFVSLLIGFPALVYTVCYQLLWGAAVVLGRKQATCLAATVTVLIGLAALIAFRAAMPSAHHRLAELRMAAVEKKTISLPDNLSGWSTAERYWLARELAYAPGTQAAALLDQLLDDAQANVVCQAIEAIGKRGNEQYVPQLLARLKQSDDWYVQWYLYRALKKLGWRQSDLP